MLRNEGSNDPTVIAWPTAESFHSENYSINADWKEFQFDVPEDEYSRPGVLTFCPAGSEITLDTVLADTPGGDPLPAGAPFLSYGINLNTDRIDFNVAQAPPNNPYAALLPIVDPGRSYFARVRTSLGSPERTGTVNVQLLVYA